MKHTDNMFGLHFPLAIEPMVYGITDRMTEAYRGGYWHFWHLSNGSFYMAPEGDHMLMVNCDNYWTGTLSADALGIGACLYCFSHLSFCRDEALSRLMAEHYHLLRAHMLEHAEVGAILGAID